MFKRVTRKKTYILYELENWHVISWQDFWPIEKKLEHLGTGFVSNDGSKSIKLKRNKEGHEKKSTEDNCPLQLIYNLNEYRNWHVESW